MYNYADDAEQQKQFSSYQVDQKHVAKYSLKPETNFYKSIHIIFVRNMQEKYAHYYDIYIYILCANSAKQN